MKNDSEKKAMQVAPPDSYLQLAGILFPSNRLMVRPGYQTTDARGLTNVTSSPLQVALYRGETLLLRWGVACGAAAVPFDQSEGETIGRRNLRSGVFRFRVKIPFRTEATRIVFTLRDIPIHEIQVPPEGPAFVENPILEKRDPKAYVLRWRAVHRSGLPLHYHVRMSGDAGASWVRLVSRLTRSELVIDRNALAGGEDCVLEVVAYDGVNTASARVAVADTPPARMEVVVLNANGFDEIRDWPILLHAVAQVRGKPRLLGKQVEYEWRCNDVIVAREASAYLPYPGPGQHVLKVKASAGGYEGCWERKIAVAPLPRKKGPVSLWASRSYPG